MLTFHLCHKYEVCIAMPVYRLTEDLVFPPPYLAEDGLLAVGGDLSRERLLRAYTQGIFPWYNEGDPILWWSPDPRMVLFPNEMHIARRLQRTLRQHRFSLSMDTDFKGVITACAATPRADQDGTWITEEMKQAYIDLFDAGFAHSVECHHDGVLVGGLYGVSLGNCFFGESMFSHRRDASKVALAVLAQQSLRWGIELIDCQVANPHLFRLGAREIDRNQFLKLLQRYLKHPARVGKWHLDADLC